MEKTILKPSAQRIFAYMQEHGSITGLEAVACCGAVDYRKRISEMRDAGISIIADYETGVNQFNEPVRYKRYRLGVKQ